MASIFDETGVLPDDVETAVDEYISKYKVLRKYIDDFKSKLPVYLANVVESESKYAAELAELEKYPAQETRFNDYKPFVDALIVGTKDLLNAQLEAAGLPTID